MLVIPYPVFDGEALSVLVVGVRCVFVFEVLILSPSVGLTIMLRIVYDVRTEIMRNTGVWASKLRAGEG